MTDIKKVADAIRELINTLLDESEGLNGNWGRDHYRVRLEKIHASLDARVAALEDWRSETTELAELRRRVEDQSRTIVSLQQQLIHEQERRIHAELR